MRNGSGLGAVFSPKNTRQFVVFYAVIKTTLVLRAADTVNKFSRVKKGRVPTDNLLYFVQRFLVVGLSGQPKNHRRKHDTR